MAIVSNLTLLATDEVRLPQDAVELRDSYFRFDQFPGILFLTQTISRLCLLLRISPSTGCRNSFWKVILHSFRSQSRELHL